jgi:hypothetical protein
VTLRSCRVGKLAAAPAVLSVLLVSTARAVLEHLDVVAPMVSAHEPVDARRRGPDRPVLPTRVGAADPRRGAAMGLRRGR